MRYFAALLSLTLSLFAYQQNSGVQALIDQGAQAFRASDYTPRYETQIVVAFPIVGIYLGHPAIQAGYIGRRSSLRIRRHRHGSK